MNSGFNYEDSIPSGHVLVFVSGSKEIEQCVTRTRLLCQEQGFDQFIVKPLHGKLMADQQREVLEFDQNENTSETLRMICFCTNVAETSLTVPGIKLVIDTGLEKVARYCPIRRMTILRECYISKSSANQRKGRAGRLSQGKCIRLFNFEKDLERESIEPEILRSSLDFVVLKLVSLNQNPLDVDLLDKPDLKIMNNSVELLSKFGCIDYSGKVTKLGKFFFTQQLDVRLSFLVLQCAQQGFLQLGAKLAAILAAPGTIYFQFHLTEKEKEDAKQRQQLLQSKFDSDLIMMLDEVIQYEEFYRRKFRLVKVYAKRNFLNNKICAGVCTQSFGIIRDFKKLGTFSDSNNNITTFSQILGKILISVFPEMICQFINSPISSGPLLFLLESQVKGSVNRNSVFSQNTKNSEFCVALNITDTDFMTFVDRLHPVTTTDLPQSVSKYIKTHQIKLKSELIIPNVGAFYFQKCMKHIMLSKGKPSRDSFYWLVDLFYIDNNIHLAAPETLFLTLKHECQAFVHQLKAEKTSTCNMLEFNNYSVQLGEGCQLYEVIGGCQAVVITRPKQESIAHFMEMCNSALGGELLNKLTNFGKFPLSFNLAPPSREDLAKGIRQFQRGFVTFSGVSNDLFKRAMEKLQKFNDVRISTSAERSRIQPQFTLFTKLKEFQVKVVVPECSVFLIKQFKKMHLYRLSFSDKDVCTSAFDRLRAMEEQVSFNYERPVDLNIFSLATVSQHLGNLYGVEVSAVANNTKISVKSSSPQQYFKASLALLSILEPLKLTFQDVFQMYFIREAKDTGLIQKWSSEANVKVEVSQLKFKILVSIFGHKVNQGHFMSTLNEYSAECATRFELVGLNPKQKSLFSSKKGTLSLFEMFITENSRYTDFSQCIKFNYLKSVLELFVPRHKRNEVTITCLKQFIREFINSNQVDSNLATQLCVFCRGPSSSRFFHCGHLHCTQCLLDHVQSTTSCHLEFNQSVSQSIKCPKCNEVVSLSDIRKTFSKRQDFLSLISKITAQCVLSSPNKFPSVTACRSFDCRSLMCKMDEYCFCEVCGLGQCHFCGALNDYLHSGISCHEYGLLKKTSDNHLEKLFLKAEEFVKKLWNIKPDLIRKMRNPSLALGCPAIQRFSKVVLKQGISCLESVKFAWHGTKHKSVGSIAYDGFDPRYRTGQVHGPGEYFGVSENPEISVGYAKGCRFMIVAAILPICGIFKEVTNYCYVVNNPIDFKTSYCLPLLFLEMDRVDIPKGEITFKPINVPVPFHFESHSVSDYDPDHSLELVARWYWQDDGGQWKAYTENLSRLIESQWSLYVLKEAKKSFIASNIVRLRDDLTQDYLISFESMTQKNIKTCYRRRIQRKTVKVNVSGKGIWQFKEGDLWKNFDIYLRQTLENAYKDYCGSSGHSVIDLSIPGRPEKYQINFAKAIQVNMESQKVRKIRRLDDDNIREDVVCNFAITNPQLTIQSTLINSVRLDIKVMIRKAVSVSRVEISAAFNFAHDDVNNQFVLRLSAGLQNLVSILTAVIYRKLKENLVIVKMPGCSAVDQNANCVNQNPRLSRLLSGERPLLDNLCRESLQEYLCHILLWECDCKIYGGYVRDWVIGNQTANDIDCTCPTTDVKATADKFLKSLQNSKLIYNITSFDKVNALCQRLKFKVGNYDMEVDFTAPGASRKIEGASPPFVEADVSNLQLCRTNYLSFKEPDASWNTDLSTVISHVMNQEFVFYYNLEKNPNQLYRLKRRLKKGWVCLSKIPASYLHVFEGRDHLYQPKYE
ncbi:hypothetical protein P9112_012666 [Eukaryota sp. TZLM1-RC]